MECSQPRSALSSKHPLLRASFSFSIISSVFPIPVGISSFARPYCNLSYCYQRDSTITLIFACAVVLALMPINMIAIFSSRPARQRKTMFLVLSVFASVVSVLLLSGSIADISAVNWYGSFYRDSSLAPPILALLLLAAAMIPMTVVSVLITQRITSWEEAAMPPELSGCVPAARTVVYVEKQKSGFPLNVYETDAESSARKEAHARAHAILLQLPPVSISVVSPDSDEYLQVSGHFDRSATCIHGNDLTIREIMRISAPAQQYAFWKRVTMLKDPQVNETDLKFFGCPPQILAAIVNKGFEDQPHQGIQFSNSSSGSDLQCVGYPGRRQMLLCVVALGRTLNTPLPLSHVSDKHVTGYDSASHHQQDDNTDHYAVFNKDQACAKYIVSYDSSPLRTVVPE